LKLNTERLKGIGSKVKEHGVEFAKEQAKEQINNVVAPVKWSIYGFLAVIVLVIVALITVIVKLIF